MSLAHRIRSLSTGQLLDDNAQSLGSQAISLGFDFVFETGVSSPGQVNKAYRAQRQLGSLANESLDLRGGLTDKFGDVIQFVNVVELMIVPVSVVDGEDFLVGPDAANGFGIATWWADVSDRSRVRADGYLHLVSRTGIAAGAGASDILYIENLTAALRQYDILIVGRSA